MIRGRNVYKVKESHIAISGRRAGRIHSYEAGEVKRCFEESEKTGFICPICNTIIDFSRAAILPTDEEYICPNDPSMPSIDRINNDLTYLWGNGRLVHLGCNCARNTTSIDFKIDKPIWSISNQNVSLTWSPSPKEKKTIYQNNIDIINENGMVKKLITIESLQKQKLKLMTTISENDTDVEMELLAQVYKTHGAKKAMIFMNKTKAVNTTIIKREFPNIISVSTDSPKRKPACGPDSIKKCWDIILEYLIKKNVNIGDRFGLSDVSKNCYEKFPTKSKNPEGYFKKVVYTGIEHGGIPIKWVSQNVYERME